ncbi:serine hydrolase domain-containing protein [Kordiimonas aestuarii]|uniref:serine hydrolase domain-containing protein n=1 Tax=Kordiimonas aestuarii TaxID=1005925 RepID=UPI0021CE3287|nr:serine hydrolase domain-containing protein [Kordiimonas aestuarii]
MRTSGLGLAAVIGLFFTLPASADLGSALDNSLPQAIEKELTSPTVTGITVAVGKGEHVVYAAGFGTANIETGEAVNASTQMRVGSISKVFTAALVGKLYEAGKLDLDVSIGTYVPSFTKKRWPVSIRQASAHMGGVRHYKGDEFLNTHHYDTVTDGIQMFAADPLAFEPGTRVSYSSHAWNLISAALEGAADEDFLPMMTRDIFKPLEMYDTAAEDVTRVFPQLSAFHSSDNDTPVIAPFVDNSYKWAGGGFIATASDVARFGLAHTEPGFLKQETLDLLFTEQFTKNGSPAGFGIGWMTASNMHARLIRDGLTEYTPIVHEHLVWHSGGSMGGVALLLVDPEHDIAIALMANHGGAFPALLRTGLYTLAIAVSEQ